MNKQNKLKTIIICLSIIALISIFFNIYLIATRTKPLEQDNNQIINNNENIIDDINDDEKKNNDTNIVEIGEKEEQEPKKEYIYKYIEGKEKQVIVEKNIEIPASSTDATITYIDASGNSKSIKLPSGTTIDFSSGEHGIYDSIPSSITLTDNQELDITDSSYNPSKVEVNYIFKGFSYSGNMMKCEYSLANNIVNAECKQISDSIIRNNVIYIKHEYIETTGTQCIDLGRKSSPNSSVELDIACENPWVGVTFFNGNGGNGSYRYHIATLSSNFHFGINSEYNANPAVDGNRHILKLSNVTGDAYVDNTLVKTFTSKGTFTTPTKNMFLNSTQSKEYIGYAKYYGFKYYENGILVMDLIPVERVSDNEIGFLNDKDGTFFQNSGSGELHTSINEILPSSNIGKITASGTYETGQLVTLTAVANDGYTFIGWSDGSTSQTKDIIIGDNTVYTALFEHD